MSFWVGTDRSRVGGWLGVLVVVAWTLGIGMGCSSLDGLGVKTPTASVRTMALTDVTAEGFTMDFDVSVTNPNAFALPLSDTTYTVALAGVDAASGSLMPPGAIAGHATDTVRLPVRMTYQQMLDVGRALLDSGGQVPYRFEAQLAARGGGAGDALSGLLGNVRVPLSYEGTLDLPALLRNPAALRSPVARRLAREALGGLLNF
ncbi:MAG: LEA type 2 family protein [Planctomycetota bacterium]